MAKWQRKVRARMTAKDSGWYPWTTLSLSRKPFSWGLPVVRIDDGRTRGILARIGFVRELLLYALMCPLHPWLPRPRVTGRCSLIFAAHLVLKGFSCYPDSPSGSTRTLPGELYQVFVGSTPSTPLDRDGAFALSRWLCEWARMVHKESRRSPMGKLLFWTLFFAVRMLYARLSRPSLLLVAASILAPSRGIDVRAGEAYISQSSSHESAA